MQFKQLSYASDRDPRFKRWLIRSIEGMTGRDRFINLYEIWRNTVVGRSGYIFTQLLELIDVKLVVGGTWPPVDLPEGPLVIVANHPFGIGDGIAILALAEQLERPFRIMIHNELLKVPEIEPYALPVSFDETKEAVEINMRTRHEALKCLREGVTVIVFPAGGVATAKRGFGVAEDLPWKIFAAKLVQSARANVIPVYFEGQNGRLFHLVSRVSLTLRISLLIREFKRLSGNTMRAGVGRTIAWHELEPLQDRKALLQTLQAAVLALRPPVRASRRQRL